MKTIANLVMWALLAKARMLADIATHIPSLTETATTAAERVQHRMRTADLDRRRAEWESREMPSWQQQDVFNGHRIGWSRRDPNLEAALADEDAALQLANLDRQLAEWDAENPAQRPDWEFGGLVQANLHA